MGKQHGFALIIFEIAIAYIPGWADFETTVALDTQNGFDHKESGFSSPLTYFNSSNSSVVCCEAMGDFNGDNYNDRFLGELVNFVASDSFQTMFETFFLTHAVRFSDDEEHRLDYYEMYQNFHDLFDKQLEDFCAQQDITHAEYVVLPYSCTVPWFILPLPLYSQVHETLSVSVHGR